MALIDVKLTLKEAQQYLELNGVDWSLQWIRTQVYFGKIPSEKMYNSRVILRSDLAKIINKKKGR